MESRILRRAVLYCALLPPTYDAQKSRRYPVLYYLHGLGENEQSLVNFGGWNLIENLQESGRIGEFLIITPDGMRSFYINSRDGTLRYEDFFLREFLPAMEARYRMRESRNFRGIAGTSMGGYGSLRMAFAHPDLFASVSAHSAALIETLPKSVAPGTGGRIERAVSVLGEVFGRPLDHAFWDRNNPLTLARESPSLAGLNIYFDCGREDDFGFDAGATALDRILESRRIAHDFHLYPGRHDWLYVAQHLPASFAFHSREFSKGSERGPRK